MELRPKIFSVTSSTVDDIVDRSSQMPWRIFSKSTVVYTKMGHVSKTTPLLGLICHLFGKT